MNTEIIKLDSIDKKILFELDKNARIPETKLAKIVNRSKESVRYRIKKLEEQKIINGFTIWIDLSKIGYTSAKIYLNLTNNPKRKKEFMDYVKKDKRLFWTGVAEGAWNIGLTYFVTSNREFFDLKNELFSEFKDIILENHTGVLVDIHIHEKTFLNPSPSEWKTLFGDIEYYRLDEIEKNLLKELYQNSRRNVVEIAKNIHSTTDIIRHRMKKLKQKGVIFKYIAKIDFNKLHYEFYKTFLYFKNLNQEDEIKLMEFCKNHPNIVHVVKQISPWDIELETYCKNYHEYNQILAELTEAFSNIIQKTKTAILSEDYTFPAEKMIFE